jgi:hypothetical protein
VELIVGHIALVIFTVIPECGIVCSTGMMLSPREETLCMTGGVVFIDIFLLAGFLAFWSEYGSCL